LAPADGLPAPATRPIVDLRQPASNILASICLYSHLFRLFYRYRDLPFRNLFRAMPQLAMPDTLMIPAANISAVPLTLPLHSETAIVAGTLPANLLFPHDESSYPRR